MNIDKRWILLFAVASGAAALASIATRSRRRTIRNEHALEHAMDLRSWENEGGNFAPAPVAAIPA